MDRNNNFYHFNENTYLLITKTMKTEDKTENKPVYIISDEPEENSNLFGFDTYAKTISGLIANKKNKTPMVIGIYGPWGSGKTTLMQTVINQLQQDKTYENKNLYRVCKTVWFQAWKYKDEDEILAALIEEIFKTMKRDSFFENCKAEVEKLIKGFDKLKGIGTITKLLSGVDISEMFAELGYKEKLGFYDTFQEFFDSLLCTYITGISKSPSREEIDDTKGSLIVFIDDLDRCPRNRILKVLETIKLFMDKKGCIFVIGAASEIIENALSGDYGEDSSKFMDKIVNVTFNLPKATATDFESFVKKISPGIDKEILPHLGLITLVIENNQRRLKRFLNNLNLQEGLLRNKGVPVTFSHLVYWNIIDYVYPLLRDNVRDNALILTTLKENIEKISLKLNDKEKEGWEVTQEILDEVKVPQSLQDFTKDKGLVGILSGFDVALDQLKQLITFSKVVEGDGEKCNTAETGIGKITPVYRYPNGISPNGCYDMAGNVWEWTSSYYNNKKMSSVLRGGSWHRNSGGCRCACRDHSGPGIRFNYIGFRCARTLTI